MRDLSVIIPARNEEWLSRTIEDVLANLRADTEIIVVLDGSWPDPPLVQHPRVNVVHLPDAIGQRAATNLGVRISTARYVMKLDAHCSVAEGFDTALIAAAQELGEDVTQVPAQKNLHIFDWVCACGWREYQGPRPAACGQCGNADLTREIVWKPRRGTTTTTWRFDADLHFQYFGEFEQRAEATGDLTETMCCLGACWFLSRNRYWQLGGLDEQHGSWGAMGVEVACKSWLSGGRLITNRRTWFAHLFRTRADFSFPYPISGADQDRARRYSRELWMRNVWPRQVLPLRWLVEKFAPVPGWSQEQIDALPSTLSVSTGMAGGTTSGAAEVRQEVRSSVGDDAATMRADSGGRFQTVRRGGHGYSSHVASGGRATATKGIVYYSDCQPSQEILEASRRSIEASGLPIVAVTLKPIRWPSARNLVLPLERGYLTMFRQILAGLEALDTDYAWLCEHDVIYAREHFLFTPPDDRKYWYDLAVWKVDADSGRAITYETKQTSGLCANRLLLIEHYRKRIARVEHEGFSRKMGFEPGSHGRPERVDDVRSGVWRSAVPNIDIRHAHNLTPSRWHPDQFRDQRNCRGWQEADGVPGWGVTRGRFREFLADLQSAALTVA